MPRIVSLDVKCEKNLMKVFIEFDKPFSGVIFSKGHYANANCVHLPAGLGRTSANFDVSINTCGTTGNTENGLYGYGSQVRHRHSFFLDSFSNRVKFCFGNGRPFVKQFNHSGPQRENSVLYRLFWPIV
jgi:hypothetical protein